MMSALAQFSLPDSAWLWVVGSLVAVVLLGGLVLAGVRATRANLADEIARELAQKGQPVAMAVQQPLQVQEATEWATRAEHRDLARRVDTETARQAAGRKVIYEKLEAHTSRLTALESATETVSRLAEKIDVNTQLTAETRGELKQINQSVTQLQATLTSFLRDRANSR